MPYFSVERVMEQIEGLRQPIFSVNKTTIHIVIQNGVVVYEARALVPSHEEGFMTPGVKTFPSLEEAVQFCYLYQEV